MLRSIMRRLSRASLGRRSSSQSARAIISTGVSGVVQLVGKSGEEGVLRTAGGFGAALRGFQIVNVSANANPLRDDGVLISHRLRANEEPALRAIVTPQSKLNLVTFATFQRMFPLVYAAGKSSGCTNCAQAWPRICGPISTPKYCTHSWLAQSNSPFGRAVQTCRETTSAEMKAVSRVGHHAAEFCDRTSRMTSVFRCVRQNGSLAGR